MDNASEGTMDNESEGTLGSKRQAREQPPEAPPIKVLIVPDTDDRRLKENYHLLQVEKHDLERVKRRVEVTFSLFQVIDTVLTT